MYSIKIHYILFFQTSIQTPIKSTSGMVGSIVSQPGVDGEGQRAGVFLSYHPAPCHFICGHGPRTVNSGVVAAHPT
ncbi:MAG: hypothetical protein WAZ30_11330, partial [Syntrophorhabdus sp.]